jgi:hypothetical protein
MRASRDYGRRCWSARQRLKIGRSSAAVELSPRHLDPGGPLARRARRSRAARRAEVRSRT